MNKGLIFPITIMGLMCCASIVYAALGDFKHAGYWFAVMIANAMVTF